MPDSQKSSRYDAGRCGVKQRPRWREEIDLAFLNEFFFCFKRDGGTLQLLKRAMNDGWVMRNMIEALSDCENAGRTSQARAARIMRTNYFDIPDVTESFGIEFSRDDLMALSDIPFSEETLRSRADSHILFPGYPLSIAEIRERAPQLFFYDPKEALPNDPEFCQREKVDLRWYLISQEIGKHFFGKSYEEQAACFIPETERPRAAEVVYLAILYQLIHGKRLWENGYAWCSDISFSGGRGYVGYSTSDWGLEIRDWTPNEGGQMLGALTSIKPSA